MESGTLAAVARGDSNPPADDDRREGATIHRLEGRRPTSQPEALDSAESGQSDQEPSFELLARARRHDPAALRELFELHKDRVAAQIQRMTGQPGAVDDLVQEVFIAAFQHLGSFRGDSQFRTWLYRIATNKVRNSVGQRSASPPTRASVRGAGRVGRQPTRRGSRDPRAPRAALSGARHLIGQAARGLRRPRDRGHVAARGQRRVASPDQHHLVPNTPRRGPAVQGARHPWARWSSRHERRAHLSTDRDDAAGLASVRARGPNPAGHRDQRDGRGRGGGLSSSAAADTGVGSCGSARAWRWRHRWRCSAWSGRCSRAGS